MGSEISLLLQGAALCNTEDLSLTVANADIAELAPTLGVLQAVLQSEAGALAEAPALSPAIDSFGVALEDGDFSQARVLQTTIAREVMRLDFATWRRAASKISLFGNSRPATKILKPEKKGNRREASPIAYAGAVFAFAGSATLSMTASRSGTLMMSDPAARNAEATELYRDGQVKAALVLWNKVLKETRSNQNRELEAMVLFSRGLALRKIGRTRPAAQSFYEAGQNFLILGKKKEAAETFALSWFLFEQGGKKIKALNAWSTAVDIAQTLSNDVEGEAFAYHLLGNSLQLLEASGDERIEIYRKAGKAYQQAGCYSKAAEEYEREGDLLVLLERTVEAAAAFDRAFLMLEGGGIHGESLQRILQSREATLLKISDSPREVYAKLADIHHQQKERGLEARAHRSRGEVFRERENYDLAAKEYLLAALIYRQMRDRQESANLQIEAARLFFRGEFYLEAAKAYGSAFRIYDGREQEKEADMALKMEAIAYKKAGHLEEAAKRFAKIAARANRTKNKKEAAEAYLNQGLVLRKWRRWEEAEKAFDKAAGFFFELRNPRTLATVQAFQSEALSRLGKRAAVINSTLYIFMGNALRDDEDLDGTIFMYEKALHLLEKQEPASPIIGNLHETLGAILVQLSRAQEAITSLDKAHHHFVAIGERQSAARVLESKKRLEEAN